MNHPKIETVEEDDLTFYRLTCEDCHKRFDGLSKKLVYNNYIQHRAVHNGYGEE
jgi:hypothetical protein